MAKQRQIHLNTMKDRKKHLSEVFYGTQDYNKLETKQKALIKAIIKKHTKNPTKRLSG